MKLHQLRYLAAVAQCGLNITAAAQKLHTSQPGVSKQIKLLEDELGFQIFVREGRNLTRITPAGQQVIDRALRILQEAQSIRDLYGSTPQGRQLLIARRLIERGVRFVQVWAGGWDHHQDIEDRLKQSASEIDKPAAALLTDLKQRGLFNSTLVVWGGEFGRTVTRDRNGNDNPGRDHNNRAFSVWLAGGGVKGGTIYGATDEFGARSVQNKVHVHDLHATMLRLLGFDHEKLTYRYNGRDFRLTDNYGQVVKGIMA